MLIRIVHKSLVNCQLLIMNMNVTKAHSTRPAYWVEATVDDDPEGSLAATNGDGKVTHAWSVTPDMMESCHGEVTSPPQSDAKTTESGKELVTTILSTFEAHVSISPDTVDGVCPIRLTETVFKLDLQVEKYDDVRFTALIIN